MREDIEASNFDDLRLMLGGEVVRKAHTGLVPSKQRISGLFGPLHALSRETSTLERFWQAKMSQICNHSRFLLPAFPPTLRLRNPAAISLKG